MTTVAVKDGIMAADGRVTMGEYIDMDNHRKLKRLSNGAIVGFGGQVAGQFAAELDFENNPEPRARQYRKTQMVYLYPDGRISFYMGGTWYPVFDNYYSIGSGSSYAVGALMAGASAIEAVRIACKRDINSGGRIRSLSL